MTKYWSSPNYTLGRWISLTSDRSEWAVVPLSLFVLLKSVGTAEKRYVISTETTVVLCEFSSHKKQLLVITCVYNWFRANLAFPDSVSLKNDSFVNGIEMRNYYFIRIFSDGLDSLPNRPGYEWRTSSFRFRTYIHVIPYDDDVLQVLCYGIVSNVSER